MRVWPGCCLLESGHLHRNKVNWQARRRVVGARCQDLSVTVPTICVSRRVFIFSRPRASRALVKLKSFALHACKATGVTMSQFQPTPHSQDIVHPTCAKCGAPMWLTRIEPEEPGSEKRTFECQACQNELVEAVKFR
jgi:hypothetical protein